MHFVNAHTNGDSVGYFPILKVIAVGDLYAAIPNPDYAAGGSLAGRGPVLTEILKLDFDVVVADTGPTVARADLQAFKKKIETMVAPGKSLAKNGVPTDRIMAQLPTSDLGFRMKLHTKPTRAFLRRIVRYEILVCEMLSARHVSGLTQDRARRRCNPHGRAMNRRTLAD
jgi:hypothetical protein